MAENAYQMTHSSETVNVRDTRNRENSGRRKIRDDKRGYWDQQDWKRSGPSRPRNGGGWGGGGGGRTQQRRPKSNTDALTRIENINQTEEKPIIFDLASGRSKMELNDWFKNLAPSKIRRSDGVGWIYILSESITAKDRKHLFESYEGIVDLRKEWKKTYEDPNNEVVTFDTFTGLAEKHDCKTGKWIVHVSQVDEFWQNIGLAFAYDKFPKGTIAMKVSPVDDTNPSAWKGDHTICVINRDMSDEKEVFGVEKVIRNFPINGEIQYKPNIFTELGIYRNNKFGIRPSIYKSIKVVGGDSDYKIKNIAKEDWLYKKPTATIDQEANVKDDNNNYLEDIQAKLDNLRQAMDEIEGAFTSLISRQNKEAEKKKNSEATGKDVHDVKKIPETVDVKTDDVKVEVKKSKKNNKKSKEKNDAKKDPKDGDIIAVDEKIKNNCDDKKVAKDGEIVAEVEKIRETVDIKKDSEEVGVIVDLKTEAATDIKEVDIPIDIKKIVETAFNLDTTDDTVEKTEDDNKKLVKEGDDVDERFKNIFDRVFNKTVTKEGDVKKIEKETNIKGDISKDAVKEDDTSVDVKKIQEATDIKNVDISLEIKKIVQDAFNVDTDGNINKKDAKEGGDISDDVKLDVKETKEK